MRSRGSTGLIWSGGAIALVAAGLGAWVAHRPPPRPLDTSALEERLAAVERGLERLGAALERSSLERRGEGSPLVPPAPGSPAGHAPQPSEPASTRRPLGSAPQDAETLESLVAELDALRTQLEARLPRVDGTPARQELVERLRDSGPPVAWNAWHDVVGLWDRDPKEARLEVKLLTAEEVLERFGPPTDVWSNSQGITWQYARDWDPVDERWGLEIILRMPDGYVTQLAVRR